MWCVLALESSSSPLHRLCIEIEQTTVGIVGFLDRFVGLAAVELVELFAGVEGVGIQRLVPTELTDLRLDRPVGDADAVTGGHRRPEPDVDEGAVGRYRI